jgi:hypothetical protein
MIRKVTLKNFKRFADVTFDVPGHLVLAGPNNTGKTTLLQAIAAWAFGYAKWCELNTDGNPRKNGHPWQDLERGQFSAVALRSFDLLWNNRQRKEPLEIGVQLDGLAAPIVMEFQFKAPGLARVRPRRDANVLFLKVAGAFTTTFVPAIAGLAREERRLADKESIFELLAQARAGEVLRNLLVQAHQQDDAWLALNAALARMFGIALLPPTRGAELTCEYKQVNDLARPGSPSFDVSTAGSGVLQVLLVLSLMLTQQGTVLLIDEPDAHLHLILQKTIYGELRSVAAKHNSQLIVATHSEQVIESVDPRELCLMYGKPRLVADTEEKAELMRSLGVLTHGDILHANGARGVLYTEDFTDLDILEAFARILADETALKLLTVELVRKRAKAAAPDGLGELDPAKHWAMLKLVSDELPAVELLDGDSKNKADDSITGTAFKMQRLRWRYYEIESYLLHPAAIRSFLLETLGGNAVGADAGMAVLASTLDERFIQRPNDLSALQLTYLRTEPVSKKLIPAVLQAAGLNNFPKSRYFEIAQRFEPQDVHPEVRYKLAQLKAAFGVGPMPVPYDQFVQTDV